ncbi:MAG: terminase small subunit [Candidatus Peribacteraceae bacterium]|nr:terminase small subunit [Candidatus Peribacteraceae bacterium]
MRPLTVKQEAFAAAMYVIGSATYGNATESARAAKYSGNDNMLAVIGNHNIRNTKIIAEKGRLQAKSVAKLDISNDKILDKIAKLADLRPLEDTDNIKPLTNTDIKGAAELLGKQQGMFKDINVNLNADIPTDPVAYRQWLRDELSRLEAGDKVAKAYDKAVPALARRY